MRAIAYSRPGKFLASMPNTFAYQGRSSIGGGMDRALNLFDTPETDNSTGSVWLGRKSVSKRDKLRRP
jgi:hypothetical protein